MEYLDDPYRPYISAYPYLGHNNVLGGGGRDPGADIYVPPQENLFSAEDDQHITAYPYIGQDNVLGGGGREPGQDIYVPPQENLYGAFWQPGQVLGEVTNLGKTFTYSIFAIIGALVLSVAVVKGVEMYREE